MDNHATKKELDDAISGVRNDFNGYTKKNDAAIQEIKSDVRVVSEKITEVREGQVKLETQRESDKEYQEKYHKTLVETAVRETVDGIKKQESSDKRFQWSEIIKPAILASIGTIGTLWAAGVIFK